ncbi:unnamed protein product [Trichobilharzia szidati]|nr:unnamed protein product [Trichobilharzia szidati]
MFLTANCSWMPSSKICRGHLINKSCFRFGCSYCRCIPLQHKDDNNNNASSFQLECHQKAAAETAARNQFCTKVPYMTCAMHRVALLWSNDSNYDCNWSDKSHK